MKKIKEWYLRNFTDYYEILEQRDAFLKDIYLIIDEDELGIATKLRYVFFREAEKMCFSGKSLDNEQ